MVIIRVLKLFILMSFFSSGIFAQSISLWHEVISSNGGSEVILKWDYVKGREVDQIFYRLMGTSDWKSVSSPTQTFTITESLLPDKTFEWRIGIDGVFSPIHYFRTFANPIVSDPDEMMNTILALPEKSTVIQNIYGQNIQFYFKDLYKEDIVLLGEIRDQGNKLMSRLALKKTTEGVYNINLQGLNVGWQQDHVYSMILYDALNSEKYISFRLTAPLANPIEASIIANPIYVNCELETTSLIEYVGSFSGGNAPYQVIWSIADGNDFSLPLQPPTLKTVTNTNMLLKMEVDYALPYLVVLSITDGCGNFDEQAMIVQCSDESDHETGLLFENVENFSDENSGTTGSSGGN